MNVAERGRQRGIAKRAARVRLALRYVTAPHRHDDMADPAGSAVDAARCHSQPHEPAVADHTVVDLLPEASVA